jgi:isopenicillin-N N-acyltransferase-like protein
VRNTVEVYRRLGCDLSAGGRVRVSDDEHEEIFGIALGAGVDGRELLAVNARTELMASRAGECSTVGQGGILAQNWDWHPDLAASTLVWIVRDGDRWFATVTEAGILAKIGMNDAGLGVCLNLLECSEDGGLAGSPIHILLRRVLTTCRTVEEAVELLTGARVCASSAVTVAHDGEVTTVELSPGGPRVVEGGMHTNHFLAAPPAGRDTGVEESATTELRLDVIRRLPLLEALRSHEGHPQGVCRHVDESEPWADRTATLASVIMDLTERRMHVAEGQPCTAPHVEIELAAATSSLSV